MTTNLGDICMQLACAAEFSMDALYRVQAQVTNHLAEVRGYSELFDDQRTQLRTQFEGLREVLRHCLSFREDVGFFAGAWAAGKRNADDMFEYCLSMLEDAGQLLTKSGALTELHSAQLQQWQDMATELEQLFHKVPHSRGRLADETLPSEHIRLPPAYHLPSNDRTVSASRDTPVRHKSLSAVSQGESFGGYARHRGQDVEYRGNDSEPRRVQRRLKKKRPLANIPQTKIGNNAQEYTQERREGLRQRCDSYPDAEYLRAKPPSSVPSLRNRPLPPLPIDGDNEPGCILAETEQRGNSTPIDWARFRPDGSMAVLAFTNTFTSFGARLHALHAYWEERVAILQRWETHRSIPARDVTEFVNQWRIWGEALREARDKVLQATDAIVDPNHDGTPTASSSTSRMNSTQSLLPGDENESGHDGEGSNHGCWACLTRSYEAYARWMAA